MDTNLLDAKFARISARLKVADRPSRRTRTEGVISLDVQSDRKGSGRVLLSERTAGRGLISADNLNGQKARILLRLALTKTTDAKEIQRMFNEY